MVTAKRSCNRDDRSTIPKTISSAAATVRNVVGSRPSEAPALASVTPTTVNDSVNPTASVHGPSRCAVAAEASRIGTSGGTQGDSVDMLPAASEIP